MLLWSLPERSAAHRSASVAASYPGRAVNTTPDARRTEMEGEEKERQRRATGEEDRVEAN